MDERSERSEKTENEYEKLEEKVSGLITGERRLRLRMNRRRATESRYNGSAINEPFVKRERKRNVSDKVRLI